MDFSIAIELLRNKRPIVLASVSRYTYGGESMRTRNLAAQVYSCFLSPLNRAVIEHEDVLIWG